MSLGILVNFPTTHQKLSKTKTFLTDSRPGYVLSMFLTVNLSLNVLIKKVLIKKKCISYSYESSKTEIYEFSGKTSGPAEEFVIVKTTRMYLLH